MTMNVYVNNIFYAFKECGFIHFYYCLRGHDVMHKLGRRFSKKVERCFQNKN